MVVLGVTGNERTVAPEVGLLPEGICLSFLLAFDAGHAYPVPWCTRHSSSSLSFAPTKSFRSASGSLANSDTPALNN